MKISTYIYMICAGLLPLTACEGSLADEPTVERPAGATGIARVGGLGCTLSDTLTLHTRAVDPFEGFVAVLSQQQEAGDYTLVRRYADAAISQQLQGQALTLPVGDYRLQLYSLTYETERQDSLMSAPVYYASTDFRIRQDAVTAVSALVATQQNIGVGVQVSDEVREFFTGHLTLKDATQGWEWQLEVSRSTTAAQWVYFPQGAAITYQMELTNSEEQKISREADYIQHLTGQNFVIDVYVK